MLTELLQQLPSASTIAGCRILVVGDIMLDRYWHGEVSRISPEAPVPVVRVQRVENRLGGAGNVALNIRTLGANVTLLSVVGKDDAAQSLRQLMDAQDIGYELCEVAGIKTIVKLRVIGRSQQMLRIDFENKPDHEELSGMLERFEALLPNYDLVLFSDYGKGGLAHVSRMICLTREASKPVLIDPKGGDWFRYAGASAITPNRAELAQVIGNWSSETELFEKVQALCRKLDLQALLLTRSEEGMTLFQDNNEISVPACAREVADVTGAGDTVIATLALMVSCGFNFQQAMYWANRAAGLVVCKFGTASLTYSELRG